VVSDRARDKIARWGKDSKTHGRAEREKRRGEIWRQAEGTAEKSGSTQKGKKGDQEGEGGRNE